MTLLNNAVASSQPLLASSWPVIHFTCSFSELLIAFSLWDLKSILKLEAKFSYYLFLPETLVGAVQLPEIQYSDKYFDDNYGYKHMVLPQSVVTLLVVSGPTHNRCIIIMPKAILRNSVFNLRTIFPHHEVHLILSTQGRILEMVGTVCALSFLMSHYSYAAGK